MPFTLFHLGSALAVGLPLRRMIHAPTLILASIVLDLEPIAVILLGLDYPLHGFMHTLIFAVPIEAFLVVLCSGWKKRLNRFTGNYCWRVIRRLHLGFS